MTSTGAAVLALALAAVPRAALALQEPHELVVRVAELDGHDPVRAESARRRLFAGRRDPDVAEAAARALQEGFERASPRAQAARLELLAAIAPPRALALATAVAKDASPSVRVAAAAALAAASVWPARAVAALLADEDPHVPLALLDALAARPLPARCGFAAAFAPELERLAGRGDPRTRAASLELLLLDDGAHAAERIDRLLPLLAPAEREPFLAALSSRSPPWDRAALAAIVAASLPRLERDTDSARLLSLRLRVQHSTGLPSLTGDELRDLLRHAGSPPSAVAEHAAATLCLLAPAIAPQLVPVLRELAGDDDFEGALEVFVRLSGVAGVDEIVSWLAEPKLPRAAALAILALLSRLPCEPMARRLDERVAPRIEAGLRPALMEAALRMPACEPRNRLLLGALRDLEGDERLRPFEALARSGDSALLGFLLDALDAEADPRVRGRMIEQIAEAFGASDADEVLAMIGRELDSPRPTDRAAALEGVPFVALGARAEAVAAELARRFAEQEVEALLHVLAQIGGATAERVFADLARRLAPDAAAVETYRFLVSRAGRLRGTPTRELLLTALSDARPRLRDTALRALIERGDEAALEHAPALLSGLGADARAALVADLGGLRHLPGYPELVLRLFVESEETPVRLALLELADPSLREGMTPLLLQFLHDAVDPAERHAALEALGRLGGDAARALLEARVAATLALEDDRFREDDACFAEGRTALLALAAFAPEAAAPRLALLLLRVEAARTRERIERTAFALPARPPLADPALVEALAARPAAEGRVALERAWDELGPLGPLCDERFFSECAQTAWLAGGSPDLCAWFDERVLELWPPDSAEDLRALLPPGRRRDALRALAFDELDDGFFAELPAIVAARARGGATPRRIAEAIGRDDPLLGISPQRTLDAAAWLAEARREPASPRAAAAIEAAARAAGGSLPLLQGVAAFARREGVELAAPHRARLAAPAIADAELLAVRRALEAERR